MILIKNGIINTMSGKKYEKGCVLIEGTKIVEVGENISAPKGAKVIDAKGMFVMPGIIDAHCHIGLWEDAMGFEGADGNEMTNPITPHMRAIDGINPMDRCFQEAYEAGVTAAMTGPGSANVIGGQFAVVKTYGKRVDDMVIKAPAAMKIAFGENPKRVYHSKNQMPETRMGTAALLRETLLKAVEYKTKKENAKGDAEKMPAVDIKLEALLPVLNREIPLKAHAHRADDMFTALRIAKEFNLKITLDHVTEGHLIVDELKNENVSLIVGPSFGERSKIELKELSFKTPGVLSNAGMKIAIMTDHPVIPLKHLPMCAAYAVKDGMKEEEALKAITINAAQILGVDDRIGSLEKGKDADIAIFDGNPLEIKTKACYVLINGNIVYESK
ncbi:imidazolonepropionase [Oxobacter pfennigii]|uniref:Imidazolonepropionase n=1 Tax=Oxobacter pfennigii TaxID=36849 RepID=A0A0P8X5W7_9CLOT|nr:amidohydrolase [Oxobacter pfennigii]KPU46303.1 imidazolonepropionase [Oxobacter pfennigii]